MISISHAPNTTSAQQRLATTWLMPWRWHRWKNGPRVTELETVMRELHGAADAVSFSTGREALLAALQACEIGTGDEVLIQAYTCLVVPNAVMWSGAVPVYVDIDETLNIDPSRLEERITRKTKAIIVQHTFGTPAHLDRIQAICQRHGLKLIEDCAHALGAKYKGALVGTFGDAAIFSFGRDKVVSAVSGGMAITRSIPVAERLRSLQSGAAHRSRSWIRQNLTHPLIVPAAARLMGRIKVGEILLQIAQALRLLNRVYTPAEKISVQPHQPFHRLPNAMAALALQQIQDHLSNFHQQRRAAALNYRDFCRQHGIKQQEKPEDSDPAYLRFACFLPNPAQVISRVKTTGYLLGDWYNSVLVPSAQRDEDVKYVRGSCPKAESYARQSLNLPTHHKLTPKHQQKLLQRLQQLL